MAGLAAEPTTFFTAVLEEGGLINVVFVLSAKKEAFFFLSIYAAFPPFFSDEDMVDSIFGRPGRVLKLESMCLS